MRIVNYLILPLLFLYGCSCSHHVPKTRVGVDPSWYPLDFGLQRPYVNGFVEETLLDMARYEGSSFELIQTSSDSLKDGLRTGKYDAVLTSEPIRESTLASFEFSSNLLDTGPVLITAKDGKWKSLDDMNDELVGVIAGDPTIALISKQPNIVIRSFNSVPELLNAVVYGDVQAAVLNRIPAINFVRDLYAGELKIVGKPMTDQGLRLMTMKGKMGSFGVHLTSLQRKKDWPELLKKWGLE